MDPLERSLHLFSNKELKELLLQYGIRDRDIEGTGKNSCILKQDRIEVVKPLIQAEFEKVDDKKCKEYKKIRDEQNKNKKIASNFEPSNEEEVLIFDFKTYKAEHDLMKQYYSGLELMLRTALFIDYKYNYLPRNKNEVFEKQIKKHKNKLEYISTVLDAFEPLYIVTQWFTYFAPEKLEKPDYIDNILNKYKLHLDVMFNRMYKARFDKDWDDTTKLWFS